MRRIFVIGRYVQDYIIFLDEDVIPSADLLNFFRQCYEAMSTEKTLSGVSAWNPYGKRVKSHFESLQISQ